MPPQCRDDGAAIFGILSDRRSFEVLKLGFLVAESKNHK